MDGTDDIDYMHARFYSPQMGRFFQVDPVNGDPRSPQSWNRYAYALNNPLNYTDPTGLTPCGKEGQEKGRDCRAAFADEITVTPDDDDSAERSQPELIATFSSNAELEAQAAAGDEFAMMLLGQQVPGLQPVGGSIDFAISAVTGMGCREKVQRKGAREKVPHVFGDSERGGRDRSFDETGTGQ